MTEEEFKNLKIGDFIIINFDYKPEGWFSERQYRQVPYQIKKICNEGFECGPKFNYCYNWRKLTKNNYQRAHIFKPFEPLYSLNQGDLVLFRNKKTGVYINNSIIVTSTPEQDKWFAGQTYGYTFSIKEFDNYLTYKFVDLGGAESSQKRKEASGWDVIRICVPQSNKSMNWLNYDEFDCKWERFITPLTIQQIEERLGITPETLCII